jgi:hypothetical protein
MTDPAAKGERFLAVSGDFISIPEVGNVLRDRMGAQARKVPTRELPNWLVRVASLRDPAAHGEQNFESIPFAYLRVPLREAFSPKRFDTSSTV